MIHAINLWWYYGWPRRARDWWCSWRALRRLGKVYRKVGKSSMFAYATSLEHGGRTVQTVLNDTLWVGDAVDYTKSVPLMFAEKIRWGYISGDCDDLANLARWAFKRQGVHARDADVVHLIGEEREDHTICVTRDGRYFTSNDEVYPCEFEDDVWTFPTIARRLQLRGFPLYAERYPKR